jgi:drug/metabolite transporter (DMT)-like permease
VTGVLWAASAGLGFGLFQAVNARAVRRLGDPFFASFVQLVVAAVVLVAICAASGDLALLDELDAWGTVSFMLAGALHFLLAWTFLNISQQRIGAARSSPLLATVPLWGIAIAALVRGELPGSWAIAAIALMVAGALTVSSPAAMAGMRWTDSSFALGTAFLWALSPIFTLEGLEEVDSPLLGVTVGVMFAALSFGLLLVLWPRGRKQLRNASRDGLGLKMVCGVIVALATWGRWVALDLAAVGVVLALNLLSVPTVLLLAPLLAHRESGERVGVRVWAGAALVVSGSLLLIALG